MHYEYFYIVNQHDQDFWMDRYMDVYMEEEQLYLSYGTSVLDYQYQTFLNG